MVSDIIQSQGLAAAQAGQYQQFAPINYEQGQTVDIEQQQQPQQADMGGFTNLASALGKQFGPGAGATTGTAGGATAGGSAAPAAGGLSGAGATAGGGAAGGGTAAAGGGMSAGGGMAAAGPWAALAAIIIGNETYAKKKGYRSEDGSQYTKDLLGGKVAVQDTEQRWSPMLFGKNDKTGMGAEMNAAPKFAMFDVKGGLKDLKNGPFGKLLGMSKK